MDDDKQASLLAASHVARSVEEDARAARREEMEHAKRAHDLNRQMSNLCRSAALDSANIAIKALLLINGGAVVALLAFVGAIESSDAGNTVQIDELVTPIFSFAFGVGCAAVTTVFAYLVNWMDVDITDSVKLTWEHPYVVDTRAATRLGYIRIAFHLLAFMAGLLAIVSFFRGIISVAEAISHVGL